MIPVINANKKWILFIICILSFCLSESQAPFSRGVNLTSWFQGSSAGSIQFTKFTKKDIADIKSLGCDIIRLPVAMHDMTSGSPLYKIDPLLFSFLDSVVTWCEDLHIYLILDNHSYDPNGDTSPGVADILVNVWSQVASHYKDRSGYILYEILNEPHGMTTSAWGTIQNQVINTIRAIDTKHTIVVGGSGYNSYNELKNLPVYSDQKLLYTFHFYDPFVFTHQGATWVTPSMLPLSGVPFPYNSLEMPACPASLKGSWIESNLNSYSANGNVSYIKNLIDNAISFRDSRGVNVFCGEFGVYIPNSDNADRCYWYKAVKDYLNEKNIPWTIWDYKGGFGLFNKGSDEFFGHDLNVRLLDSLGFNIPVQTPLLIKPDSTGFMIYTDYIASGIENSGYSAGPVNFYSDNLPANDRYCLYWNGFNQYNAVGFNFIPDKDMTRLVSENFALDFMVRGSEPGIKFEIRFKDTKTSVPGDRPWRMGTTIDASDAQWDRKWHHVRIPLSEFTERGAWDIDTWYNPEGKFDWSKADVIEISTEYTDILGKKIWFDNIHISDVDTAIVRVDEALGIFDQKYNKLDLKISPNPMDEYTEISIDIRNEGRVTINIFTDAGIKIRILTNGVAYPGKMLMQWDGRCDNGMEAEPGIYFCQIKTPGYLGTGRIIKY
jgi:endoglucanase